MKEEIVQRDIIIQKTENLNLKVRKLSDKDTFINDEQKRVSESLSKSK